MVVNGRVQPVSLGCIPSTTTPQGPGFESTEAAKCSVITTARATLRSVCAQWDATITNDTRLWTDIHVNGARIPCSNGGLAQASGELSASALSIELSQDQLINLVLINPTYNTVQRVWREAPYTIRPGILSLIRKGLKKKVTELTLSTKDIGFVRDIKDELTIEQKIELCFTPLDPPTRQIPEPLQFAGICTRRQRKRELEANYAALAKSVAQRNRIVKDLHTLRIVNPEWTSNWKYDFQRMVLPATVLPNLRHLELQTKKYPLCLFAFPYTQLTHLTLDAKEDDEVVLGVLKRCVSLKNLTITLYQRMVMDTGVPQLPVVLESIESMFIHIYASDFGDPGKYFMNRIKVPNMEDAEVECWNTVFVSPLSKLIVRSGCHPHNVRLEIQEDKPTSEEDLVIELDEIISAIASSVEHLAIKAPLTEMKWLERLIAPKLQTLKLLSFNMDRNIEAGLKAQTVADLHTAALAFFMRALLWTEEWMKESSHICRWAPVHVSSLWRGRQRIGGNYLPQRRHGDCREDPRDRGKFGCHMDEVQSKGAKLSRGLL
ncbi:hypothetical protein DFP72DRAFT_1075794 [Ephemerocybe angulata]|uniref:Uncharacterized protein n=1 Tax=Ephemerocybe angulata TaxID=980116 RepID=A0A8H6LYQ9_9AGAR|nr:hypothetical protein DFP72DRAFT_1075794 [Tulosesus angulatus]